jgi:uracil DNA glycosylase
MDNNLRIYLNETLNKTTAFKDRVNEFINKEGVFPKQDLFGMFDNVNLSNVRVVLFIPHVIYPYAKIPLSREKSKYNPELFYEFLSNIIDSIKQNYYDNFCIMEENYFDFTFQDWINQGVLILPQSLAVNTKELSNVDKYKSSLWAWIVGKIVQYLNEEYTGKIYAFWDTDRYLTTVKNKVNKKDNYILECEDTSESTIFNEINNVLEKMNGKEARIKWMTEYETKIQEYSELFGDAWELN